MFWERYCDLCAKKGMSKTAAGKDAGIAKSTISQWKSGSVPEGATLNKLAKYFSCSVDYLLGYTDDRSPPAAPGIEKSPAGPNEPAGEAWLAELTQRYLLDAGILHGTEELTPRQMEYIAGALEAVAKVSLQFIDNKK